MVYDGDMPDEDDRVFYEVSLSEDDSFLVTGNLKHFPKTPKVITAAQMMEILDNDFEYQECTPKWHTLFLYTSSPANFTLKPNTVANIISMSFQNE